MAQYVGGPFSSGAFRICGLHVDVGFVLVEILDLMLFWPLVVGFEDEKWCSAPSVGEVTKHQGRLW
jgi:hypothetical protein